MKKSLITGVSGFVGNYLAEYLLDHGGFEIIGTYLNEKPKISEKISLHKIDLLDEDGVNNLIKQTKPDYIFHLAALTSPRDSFENPKETFINNVSSQINLLEAIKNNGLKNSKILIVSSAEVYGLVKSSDLPMDEETPLNPTNPYAVSKISQDFLGLQYFLTHKLKIVRVRPFNHVGPRQFTPTVISSFAKKIVEIEKGKEKIMKVGNLTSRRDFTDVRDMVRAYLLALEKGKIGDVYNIGSGKSYEIAEILKMMIGFSNAQIKTEEDPSLISPSDDPELKCDFTKFKKLTGWEPQIPIEETLKDTLEYWRRII